MKSTIHGSACAVEIDNNAEHIFKALHFQNIGVRSKFPSGAGLSHYRPDERVMECQFNASS